MQMFYEDEQVSMFAPDSCAGKMSPAHSPAGSKREMTSESSWRKRSELVYQEFMFLKITEEIVRIKVGGVSIPRPYPWPWQPAGRIVLGADFSLAWRCLDAQYWGVPQSRKRIFLVADLGTPSSAQILFEPESLPGHSP